MFKLRCGSWYKAAWVLLRLTGSGCLAVRPELWRESKVGPMIEVGEQDLLCYWWQVEVWVQLALLQEGLLADRISNILRAFCNQANRAISVMSKMRTCSCMKLCSSELYCVSLHFGGRIYWCEC